MDLKDRKITAALGNLYGLVAKHQNLSRAIDRWNDGSRRDWFIQWNGETESTELFAERNGQIVVTSPFTEDSTVDDLQKFVDALIVMEVHNQ